MAMQATTLDILIEKGQFDPKVAHAMAEAIDNEIQGSQLVTVPLLDARLAALRVEIHDAVSGLERRMYASLFAQFLALLGVLYFFTEHLAR